MQNNEITQLEKKINQVQTIINNYRNELNQYENTLLTLTKELSQIKQNTMKSINKNSPLDFKAIK